jgi:glycosyltransferase involved in cell wall biosynthesis
VITRLNIGGPSVHTVLLTRDMTALGYRTTLATGLCEAEDGDMTYLLDPGDPVRWVPELSRSVRPWSNLRALYRLWRIMRAERPTIVHTHTAMAGCVGRLAAILAGVPVIVHTFHGNSLRQYFSPAASAVFLRIERLLGRATDAICVVSEQQLEELAGELRVAPRSRFHVVPLGLDLDPYLALSPAPPADGVLRVGWFGRLVPVKNVPLLVEVIEATERSGVPIEFHVAGDGPDRGILERAAARFGGRLVWHGWQKDITPILQRCDVLLQTSLNEGTPLALIQGMAAARPFVSTPVGGVVDMASGTARSEPGMTWFSNGILADAEAGALAAALTGLRADPGRIRAMGQNARALAARRYPKQALCARLDGLYRELLSRSCIKS